MKKLNLIHRAVALILTACLVAPGCLPAEEGPALPPAESMQMDMSVFTGGLTAAKGDESTDASKANFQNAALRVGLLNLTVGLALVPPAAVLAAALSAEPRFEAGTWIWTYELQSGGETFEAELTGWFEGFLREGTTLELEMRVTCTACAAMTEDYLWYTGSFQVDGAAGHWQLYNPQIAQADQSFVRIDYAIDDETHRSLTFENVRTDGSADAGDIIDYTRDGDLLAISVEDISDGQSYLAEGDLRTGAGWIEVPGYNGGEKACWDADQLDVACE